MSDHRHVALLVEVPILYTGDLDRLRDRRQEFDSESDWLLDCIRVGGPVRLRVEVNGSEVVEVWGHAREARLVEPGALTDEMLRELGERRLLGGEGA